MLGSVGGYPTSLRLIIALLGESVLTADLLSGELRYLVMFFSRTYLDTLEDRTIILLRQLCIAPVSEVGEEDLRGADSLLMDIPTSGRQVTRRQDIVVRFNP